MRLSCSRNLRQTPTIHSQVASTRVSGPPATNSCETELAKPAKVLEFWPLSFLLPDGLCIVSLSTFPSDKVAFANLYPRIDAATPTWAPMNEQLGFSYDTLNNSYAAGCGALAIGACVLIPFALKYGRRPVYIFSTAVQFGVCIWSAHQQTVADLMMVNILSCFVGALSEVVVQMTVADVFFVNQRGTMNSLFFWSTRIGASLTPLAAGYVTVSQGWRWVWWWIAIFFGVLLLLMVFGYEETKFVPPAIEGVSQGVSQSVIDRKSSRDDCKDPELARTATGRDTNSKLTTRVIDPAIPRKTYKQRLALTTSSPGSLGSFFRHCYQPFQILFTVPGVFYMSLVYGGMMVSSNVLVTTLSRWMAEAPYNFDPDQIGLMSLAPFAGSTLGTLLCGPLSDWWILYLSRRNGGVYEPEMRLWVMAAFAPFVPVGMVLFGVGLGSGWPWPILAVAYGLCSFGTAPAGTISLTYMTDAYTEVRKLHNQPTYAEAVQTDTKSTARLLATPWWPSPSSETFARSCSSSPCPRGLRLRVCGMFTSRSESS